VLEVQWRALALFRKIIVRDAHYLVEPSQLALHGGEAPLYLGGGGAARTGRFRGPITRESGTAEKGCSVKRAFIPSMLRASRWPVPVTPCG